VAINLEPLHETINELMLDIDLFTMQPMPTESFDAHVWLTGCNKSISRDAYSLLDLMKSMHE
jgi:hypothetical protein